MIARLFVAVLLVLACALWPALAAGEACAPRTWFWPVATATAEVRVEEPDGEWSYWWCKRPDGSWYLVTWAQVAGHGNPETRAKVEEVIRTAATPDAGVSLAFERFSTIPSPGTEVRTKFDALRYRACLAGVASAPDGVARTCTAPPSAGLPEWQVDAATSADGTRPAYPFVGGVRGAVSSSRAKAGQPCDPGKGSAPALSGGVWAVFGPDFDQSKVALCVKR